MIFFIPAVGLFSFLAGVFACCLANGSRSEDLFVVLLLFTSLVAAAFGFVTMNGWDALVARQQLLEQKCIQAGLAVMKTVATEERFEFIEALPVPAEKSEP